MSPYHANPASSAWVGGRAGGHVSEHGRQVAQLSRPAWGRWGTAEVLIERQLFVKKRSSRSRMRSMLTLSCVRSAFLSAAGGTPRGGQVGRWVRRGLGDGTVEHGEAGSVRLGLARLGAAAAAVGQTCGSDEGNKWTCSRILRRPSG